MRSSLRLNDAVSNNPVGRFPLGFGNGTDTIAWAEMLSSIGQRNSQLYGLVSRSPLAGNAGIHDRPSIDVNKDKNKNPHRGVANAVMQELERERTRIARDLHAGAGQPLAGIKLNLEMLDHCATILPETGRAALARLQSLTQQALDQVRAVSHKLHPPEWQLLSTEEALRRLLRASGLMERIQVLLDIQPLAKEPSHSVKIAIYRCAQECVSNVARHSGATDLRVSLQAQGPVVELTIEDNGCGFREDKGSDSGIGLTAIRDYAAALGGTCDITSSPRGVKVIVQLPLDPDEG
jgi:signal transduction histidine kinase